jgi:hypothetical protein
MKLQRSQQLLESWNSVDETLVKIAGKRLFSHTGNLGEKWVQVKYGFVKKKKGDPKAADFRTSDGKTVQVKTTTTEGDAVTISYNGDEGVDYLLVIEKPMGKEPTVVFYGDFTQAIADINVKYKEIAKDNHRRVNKSYLVKLHKLYGIELSIPRPPMLSKFFTI